MGQTSILSQMGISIAQFQTKARYKPNAGYPIGNVCVLVYIYMYMYMCIIAPMEVPVLWVLHKAVMINFIIAKYCDSLITHCVSFRNFERSMYYVIIVWYTNILSICWTCTCMDTFVIIIVCTLLQSFIQVM